MRNRYVKLCVTVLVLMLLLLCGCASAQAEATTVASGSCGKSLTWELDSAGTLTISGSGAMQDFDRYNYSPVPWYSSYSNKIKTVVIADGVTGIGNYAFYGCSNLARVTIPDSVTRIGYGVFEGCSGLTDVTIPGGVTSISGNTFYNCSSLTSITIPGSVTSIGGWAFYGCSGLTRIAIPDSVTSIENSAFKGCSGLTHIEIPQAVISGNSSPYASGAFAYLFESTLAAEVIVADGATSIGQNAFYNCALTRIAIPDSVTSIGDSAFRGCSGLTSIAIPDGVTSIGNEAFYGCSGLTGIAIPDGVTIISDYAFSGCYNLTRITIPDRVTRIGNEAFRGCSALTGIAIPDTVTSIGNYAFYNCSSLTGITIPGRVTSIGYYAFYNCSSLTRLTIPGSVSRIENFAFSLCRSLTRLTIPDGVTSIGDDAFSGCISLTRITLPGSVTSIGNSAFSGCSGLTSIAIPDGVNSIGNAVFRGCSSLTSVTIPGSVTGIGYSAFQWCDSLTSVTIPGSVTSIGDSALSCANLDKVLFEGMDMPAMGTSVFQGAPTIYCYENSDVDSWAVENDYHYIYLDNLDMTVPLELNLPGSHTLRLNDHLDLSDCVFPATAVSNVEWTSSAPEIVSVKDGVLTAVGAGDAVITASYGELSDSIVITAYATLSLPEDFKMIAGERMTIAATTDPASEPSEIRWESSAPEVVSVENGVLTALGGGKATITATWRNVSDNCEIMVHTEAIDPAVPATHATTGWTEGRHCSVCDMVLVPQKEIPMVDVPIVSLSASLTVIEDQAYYGDAFQCVVIPEGCKKIGAGAFGGNTALRFVEIPASVESIDASAFDGCGRELIIVTTSGSAAEAYAAENSIVCILK